MGAWSPSYAGTLGLSSPFPSVGMGNASCQRATMAPRGCGIRAQAPFSRSSPVTTAMYLGAAFDAAGTTCLTVDFKGARLWRSAGDGGAWQPFLFAPGEIAKPKKGSFSLDGDRVVLAGPSNHLGVWQVSGARPLAEFTGHVDAIWTAVFSPDGQHIVSASRDQSALLWESATGKLVSELRGHSALVLDALFSPDGKRILTVGLDHTGQIWDVTTGRAIVTIDRTGSVGGVFSPDSRAVAIPSDGDDRVIGIWEAASGQAIARLLGHAREVQDLEFAPDGSYLVSGSSDGTAILYPREMFSAARGVDPSRPTGSLAVVRGGTTAVRSLEPFT